MAVINIYVTHKKSIPAYPNLLVIELVIWLNFIDELEIIAMAKSRDNQQR